MEPRTVTPLISGIYLPLPTFFVDPGLDVNLPAMRRHVRFLIDAGIRSGNGALLAGGGAGEFSTLSTNERLSIAEAVIAEAAGKVGVVVGVQHTNPHEIVTLCREAKKMGALAVQIAPPFYEVPTADDVYEFLAGVAEAVDIPQVLYTTYWTGFRITFDLLERLLAIPQLAAVKIASPSGREFEGFVRRFSGRICMIDNQLEFIKSHMLGGRAVNLHPANWYPSWALKFWELLETRKYFEAQKEMSRVVGPCYDLYGKIGEYTGGEGHLDKMCLELIGFDSSRCRPPVRDVRDRYREHVRRMLLETGVPGVRTA
ncbi:MAG: dihydrodipicolinate synthase family protein [Planctomycetia bacterium]|nr:dihydrodipicolinate synthase family protein [Planctomycetia bacterium]